MRHILVSKQGEKSMMKGFNGDTRVIIKSNGNVENVTLRELNRRFRRYTRYRRYNGGEILQIMSFNEETKQNEWKNVTHSSVSDEKYKMNRMKVNKHIIYATGDVNFYTATGDVNFYTDCDVKYDEIEMMEFQDNVHLILNAYTFTSEFKLTKIDNVYHHGYDVYNVTLTLENGVEENVFVPSNLNIMTAKRGYVNILEVIPNEDIIFFYDHYSSGGIGFDIEIDVLQDHVFNISVEDNRNFYANGFLVKQNI